MKTNAPIGIFDSGIGGLTVANAIRSRLPSERIIYFGDTAHLPYGDKAPGSIKAYAIKISDFLVSQGCKIIIIACNSASSTALTEVRNAVGNRCPVVDVISPVVQKVTNGSKIRKVGVIGTRATIRSKEYQRQINEKRSDFNVVSVATPLLAPMIEEGFFNNSISSTIINSYLSLPRLRDIDDLILACTHYPLIMDEISEFYDRKVRIINSAEIVADKVVSVLKRKNMLSSSRKPVHHFYVSDHTDSFEKSTQLFFESRIRLEHLDLWERD